MNPLNRASLTEQYLRLRAELIAEHPDIDETTLQDTLEGESAITDTIAEYIRDALDDETWVKALALRMKDLAERQDRLAARASKRRHIAMALMNAIELRKLDQPDFTASIRATPPKIIVMDDTLLPDAYCRIVREPNKLAIKDALSRGVIVAGAAISNGSETLAIKTR